MRLLMNTLLALIQHRSRFMRSDKTLSQCARAVLLSSCRLRSLAPGILGLLARHNYSARSFGITSILLPKAAATAIYASEIPPCRRLHPIAHGTFPMR
jgi:hypothetical protein